MSRKPYQDPELSTEERLADLLPRMSLQQKVGQLVQADGRQAPGEQFAARQVGSFLHILGKPTIELQKQAEQTALGIPIIFGIDAIHGHGFWPGATVFPTQLALSCSWNTERFKEMAQVTAKEMAVTGMHWTFSPVLCISRDLRWGRVNETSGEDPLLIGDFGAAMVEGYQGNDLSAPDAVLACAKHYAAYSETVGGRDATEAEISRRKLHTYFLPPFEKLAKAGCKTFMTAYQCIDGVSCMLNRWLLTDLLREQWGFDGFVVTDWDNVGRGHRVQKLYDDIQSLVPPTVNAGNDMIMCTPEFYDAAIAGVEAGSMDGADIDRACARVLRQKFDLGLFDHKRYPKIERVPEVIGCAAHREKLLPAALESMVLLKNDSLNGAPVLPLSSNVKKVAVLGPNADDHLAQLGDWSFGSGQASFDTGGHPAESVVTVLQGIQARATQADTSVTYARGCDVLDPDESGVMAAAKLAVEADVAVVVVGDVLEQVGEECDRSDLTLSGGQQALLEAVHATGTPLVVVLINSKPLCIPWIAEQAQAVLEAFNPGMKGGTAVARLLFGDDNPMGKLTISFATEVGAQPAYYQQIPGWHGDKHNNYKHQPLYSFGFGLSYTRYDYSAPRLATTDLRSGDPLRFEVDVTNVGPRAGVEIVQVYLNDVQTRLSTHEKELKAYRRVELQPGETQTLSFELPHQALAYAGSDGTPTIEPGDFDLMVGSSSRDVDLKTSRFRLS